MELYILNPDLEIIKVVDTASSVIWTRRYYEAGDFEIYIKADDELLDYLVPDNYIMRFNSDMTGVIDAVELDTDSEDGNYITVSGKDLKSLLSRRIIWQQINVSGTVKSCIETILNNNVINPSIAARKLSNLILGAYTISDIAINAQYTGVNIYDLITELCKTYNLGWNIKINTSNQFEFYMYEGANRSYAQNANDFVVFSDDFENLITTEYAYDKNNLKNVALVAGEGEGTYRRMYTVGDYSNVNRRELFVDARDITSDSGEDVTESFTVSSRDQAHTFTNYIYEISSVTVEGEDTDNFTFNNPEWTNRTVYFHDAKSRYNTSTGAEIYVNYAVTMTYRKALTPAEYNALLNQRGLEKLAEVTATEGISGEVDTTRQYIVDQDFYLGDIVQVVNEFGLEAQPRIIEIIECEDENGISVIPTFTTWEVI